MREEHSQMGNSCAEAQRQENKFLGVMLDGVQEMGVAGEEVFAIRELLVKGQPCVLCLSRKSNQKER